MIDAELLAVACSIIRDTGWAFYFTPETLARGAELGLDRVHFYALGRGGVLGDVEPAVVLAAFGYFNPALVAGLWNAAKAVVRPRVAGSAYMQCSAEDGRLKLTGLGTLAGFVPAADKILAATQVDAITLFAGVAAEPMVDDIAGRAMQLLIVLREYRGSAHLVAVRAVGLDTKTAHFVTRPNDAAMFGWGARRRARHRRCRPRPDAGGRRDHGSAGATCLRGARRERADGVRGWPARDPTGAHQLTRPANAGADLNA